MKNTLKTVVLSLVATTMAVTFSTNSQACSVDGKEGFLPRNNLYIPTRREVIDESTGGPVGGGITEAEFNAVIDSVVKIYTPIVAEMGGTLKVARNWADGTVNAYANREGNEWWINMFGGLARHKETTIDGFLLVVCHELGHQIGGAPKYSSRGQVNEWAGNEGQSDYWATLKCARRVLAQENNIAEVSAMSAPYSVHSRCETNFRDANEAAICVRSAMGGLSLSRLLSSLGKVIPPPEEMPWFSHQDPNRVAEMYDPHPATQCRLDTYYAGALCDKDYREDVDQKDGMIGTCNQEQGYRLGVRPRCWYAPSTASQDAGNPRTRRDRSPPVEDGRFY